jgi:hypothetical protein
MSWFDYGKNSNNEEETQKSLEPISTSVQPKALVIEELEDEDWGEVFITPPSKESNLNGSTNLNSNLPRK